MPSVGQGQLSQQGVVSQRSKFVVLVVLGPEILSVGQELNDPLLRVDHSSLQVPCNISEQSSFELLQSDTHPILLGRQWVYEVCDGSLHVSVHLLLILGREIIDEDWFDLLFYGFVQIDYFGHFHATHIEF